MSMYTVIVFVSDATNVSEAAGSETAGAQELSRYLAHNRLAPSWLDCDVPYSPLIRHFFCTKTVVHQQVAHEIPTQREQRFLQWQHTNKPNWVIFSPLISCFFALFRIKNAKAEWGPIIWLFFHNYFLTRKAMKRTSAHESWFKIRETFKFLSFDLSSVEVLYRVYDTYLVGLRYLDFHWSTSKIQRKSGNRSTQKVVSQLIWTTYGTHTFRNLSRK